MKHLILIPSMLALSGCVTVGQLEAVRDEAAQAQVAAGQAQATADEALAAAQSAQACCVTTNDRLDRMFEASQAK